MNEPGAIIGQAVVNVRACGIPGGPHVWESCAAVLPEYACFGCQGNGTWLDTSEATAVERMGLSRPWADTLGGWQELTVWRPVENGDTE